MKCFSTFPVLFFLLLLPACTLQKRTFRTGYHIEWKHGFRRELAAGEKSRFHPEGNTALKTVVAAVPEVPEPTAEKGAIDTTDPVNVSKPVSVPLESRSRPDNLHFTPPDTTRTEQQEMPPPDESMVLNEHKTVEPLSWISLGTSLTYTGLFALVLLQLIDPLFIILLILLFIATIVIAIVSINRYRHNKEIYYRPHIAVLSMIILGVSLIVLLLVGLIYFLNVFFEAIFGALLGN